MEARKVYATVYWGKMPVNFRPQIFEQREVEDAIRQAERSFPDVLDLVPDFSVLAVDEDVERNDKTGVLRLGYGGKPIVFRRATSGEKDELPGLLRDVARRVRSRRG